MYNKIMTRTLTDSNCVNLHSVSGGELSASVLVKQKQKIETPPEFLSTKCSPCVRKNWCNLTANEVASCEVIDTPENYANHRLRQSWYEFLSSKEEWQLRATLTFIREISVIQALKKFQLLLYEINRFAFAELFYRVLRMTSADISVFAVATPEIKPDKRIHIHALFGGLPPAKIDIEKISSLWTGNAKIAEFDNTKKQEGIEYILKYLPECEPCFFNYGDFSYIKRKKINVDIDG
jgi:hypothetical protein